MDNGLVAIFPKVEPNRFSGYRDLKLQTNRHHCTLYQRLEKKFKIIPRLSHKFLFIYSDKISLFVYKYLILVL